MKKLAIYLLLLFSSGSGLAQYYLRGEIKDEKGKGISNARIYIHSARTINYSGSFGSFGFNVLNLHDSLTVSSEGYESKTLKIRSDQWQEIILKLSAADANRNKHKLISVTRDHRQEAKFKWFVGDETYFQLIENDYINTGQFPGTGFSLNVNKSSYSNIRRFLNMDASVPPDAVRAEEMINYFNIGYEEPKTGETFSVSSILTGNPVKKDEQLLFINVNAMKLDLHEVPPGNFVFLIDNSGSMDHEKKLGLLKAAFQMLVKNLRTEDTISIITYGGGVSVWLPPTGGAEKERLSKAIEELTAQGDTPGESAIRAAYKLAESTFIKNGNNRVILATDGDFNVGETSEKALDELITRYRQSGVYLTCLGVGMGNFKDSKLQTLAKKGNGNYAYLDDILEAERVLVKELTQTMYAVANDATINVRFNPSMVKRYRLIGFDNRREALLDTTTSLEGGEVGSGNNTMAIFQIEPTEQNLLTCGMSVADDIASIAISWSHGKDTAHTILNYNVPAILRDFSEIPREYRFATAVGIFSLKLKQSKYLPAVPWQYVETLAKENAEPGNYLQQQFVELVNKAWKIYEPKKKKKTRGRVS